MESVMRVVPDPAKDIGFGLIAVFHHHPRLRTQTYENLADAMQTLSDKSPATVATPPAEAQS